MAKLVHRDGGSAEFDSPEEIQAALASGEWSLPEGESSLPYTSAAGHTKQLTPEQAANQPGQGYLGTPDPSAGFDDMLQGKIKEAYSGLGDQILGGIEGAASVATLSTSDLLLKALGTDVANRSKHTAGRQVGEIVGTVGLALSPFGKGRIAKALTEFTPGGQLGKFGMGGATAPARVGRMALEGAGYGAAAVTSEVALRDPEFSAEAFLEAAPEIGKGAILGLITGGGVGAGLEGLARLGARSTTKVGRVNLDSGPGREMVNDFARTHTEFESVLDAVEAESRRAANGAAAEAQAAHAETVRGLVTEVRGQVSSLRKFAPEVTDPLRAARAQLQDSVTTGAVHMDEVDEFVDWYDNVAEVMGKPGLKPEMVERAVNRAAQSDYTGLEALMVRADKLLAADQVTDAALEKALAGFERTGSLKHAAAYLDRARAVATKLDRADIATDLTERLALLKADSDLAAQAGSALKRTIDRTPGRKAFDLPDGIDFSPTDFRRLIDAPPEEAFAKLGKLAEYYKAARSQVADAPEYAARLDAVLGDYNKALGKLVNPEAAAQIGPHLFTELAGAAGVTAVLPSIEGTPVDDIAKGYLALQLLGGVRGVKARGRTFAQRMARGMFTRGMMSMASQAARATPGLRGAGGMAENFVASQAAASAYVGSSRVADNLLGVRAAADATTIADKRIADAMSRLAKGEPRKRVRLQPFMRLAIDALYSPAPTEKPATDDKAKFRAIQENLSRYEYAPDAAGAALYDTLRPVADGVGQVFSDSMEMLLHTKFAYLAGVQPRDPGTMVQFGRSVWQPTAQAMYEFAAHAMGALYPLETIDMIADGTVPPQAIEALAAASPAAFRKFQEAVIDNFEAIAANSTYSQRIALSLASKVPLDPTMDPRYTSFIQNMHAQAEQAGTAQTQARAPEGSGPTQDYTEAQRLLA